MTLEKKCRAGEGKFRKRRKKRIGRWFKEKEINIYNSEDLGTRVMGTRVMGKKKMGTRVARVMQNPDNSIDWVVNGHKIS